MAESMTIDPAATGDFITRDAVFAERLASLEEAVRIAGGSYSGGGEKDKRALFMAVTVAEAALGNAFRSITNDLVRHAG